MIVYVAFCGYYLFLALSLGIGWLFSSGEQAKCTDCFPATP